MGLPVLHPPPAPGCENRPTWNVLIRSCKTCLEGGALCSDSLLPFPIFPSSFLLFFHGFAVAAHSVGNRWRWKRVTGRGLLGADEISHENIVSMCLRTSARSKCVGVYASQMRLGSGQIIVSGFGLVN